MAYTREQIQEKKGPLANKLRDKLRAEFNRQSIEIAHFTTKNEKGYPDFAFRLSDNCPQEGRHKEIEARAFEIVAAEEPQSKPKIQWVGGIHKRRELD